MKKIATVLCLCLYGLCAKAETPVPAAKPIVYVLTAPGCPRSFCSHCNQFCIDFSAEHARMGSWTNEYEWKVMTSGGTVPQFIENRKIHVGYGSLQELHNWLAANK